MARAKASTTRRSKSRKTPAQIAASKRNLEKARAARKSAANTAKYGHLAPGTYIIGNDGSVKRSRSAAPKVLVGKAIRKALPPSGPTIKFHPYTGKPYDLRDIKGGKEIPLIGLKEANKWLKANTISRRKRRK